MANKHISVEARIANGFMKRVYPGDILQLECGRNYVDVKVLSMVKYMSFKEMLENEGLMNCVPDCANIEAGVRVYYSFPHYKRLEASLGVIAFRITTDNSEAATVPRPLFVVRGHQKTHLLTKEEIQKEGEKTMWAVHTPI